MDNNGALDLVYSGAGKTVQWLVGAERRPEKVSLQPLETLDVTDVNGDGQLDLVGTANGLRVELLGKGTKGYHWQVMRPQAQPTAGDQRINSFGIGGEIEIRS